MLAINTRVVLRSFNGAVFSPEGCHPGENYWVLIGEKGSIVEPLNEKGRFLVKFDNSLANQLLHCHNPAPNSLYVLATDLEEIS
jgi:hypothetical protein